MVWVGSGKVAVVNVVLFSLASRFHGSFLFGRMAVFLLRMSAHEGFCFRELEGLLGDCDVMVRLLSTNWRLEFPNMILFYELVARDADGFC
jgi:hypothetical protein